ncbi:WD40-repeat-containing domain protein [Gaertneriomyces semiglobifer]|nr:WD40-repeat-containing domain protein [Gaertneriomyces semiglobifer]
MVTTTLGDQPQGERLTSSIISSFEVARVFTEHTPTSLDFDDSGELLITSGADDALRVWDCLNGTPKEKVYSKKYGCTHAKFTHSRASVIYASTKEDDTIRYLSLHDNIYLRYFRGHTSPVSSLEMSPQDDHFLSASVDGTVRLWDLKAPHCQGFLRIPSTNTSTNSSSTPPSICFDQTGKVFTISSGQWTKLYDLRNFDKGPFTTFTLPSNPNSNSISNSNSNSGIYHSEFSNDGKLLLVATGEGVHVLDGFSGAIHQSHPNTTTTNSNNNTGCKPCFSPDAQFVFTGGDDSSIRVFSTTTSTSTDGGKQVALLKCMDTPRILRFNPKWEVLVSAERGVVVWTRGR